MSANRITYKSLWNYTSLHDIASDSLAMDFVWIYVFVNFVVILLLIIQANNLILNRKPAGPYCTYQSVRAMVAMRERSATRPRVTAGACTRTPANLYPALRSKTGNLTAMPRRNMPVLCEVKTTVWKQTNCHNCHDYKSGVKSNIKSDPIVRFLL